MVLGCCHYSCGIGQMVIWKHVFFFPLPCIIQLWTYHFLILISYFVAQIAPDLAIGRFFSLAPVSFQHAPEFFKHFFTFWHHRCSKHILCISCASPGSSHFSKAPCFLLLENKSTFWARCFLVSSNYTLQSSLLSLSSPPSIPLVQTSVMVHLDNCLFMCPPISRLAFLQPILHSATKSNLKTLAGPYHSLAYNLWQVPRLGQDNRNHSVEHVGPEALVRASNWQSWSATCKHSTGNKFLWRARCRFRRPLDSAVVAQKQTEMIHT